jgi:hypothetical protein
MYLKCFIFVVNMHIDVHIYFDLLFISFKQNCMYIFIVYFYKNLSIYVIFIINLSIFKRIFHTY